MAGKWNCKLLSKVKYVQISLKKYLIRPVIETVRYREVTPRVQCKLGPKNNFCSREVSVT